jgi:hypothetical protein
MERQKIRFASGETQCTAWHYPGANGGCVIMAGGFAVTKEPGTGRGYEPFLGGHERAVGAELSFLRRHLLGESAASRPGAGAGSAGRPA